VVDNAFSLFFSQKRMGTFSMCETLQHHPPSPHVCHLARTCYAIWSFSRDHTEVNNFHCQSSNTSSWLTIVTGLLIMTFTSIILFVADAEVLEQREVARIAKVTTMLMRTDHASTAWNPKRHQQRDKKSTIRTGFGGFDREGCLHWWWLWWKSDNEWLQRKKRMPKWKQQRIIKWKTTYKKNSCHNLTKLKLKTHFKYLLNWS